MTVLKNSDDDDKLFPHLVAMECPVIIISNIILLIVVVRKFSVFDYVRQFQISSFGPQIFNDSVEYKRFYKSFSRI